MKKATKKTIGRFSGLVIGVGILHSIDPFSSGSLIFMAIGGIVYLSVAAQFDGDSNEN